MTLADVLKTTDALLKIGDGERGVYFDQTDAEFVVYQRGSAGCNRRKILARTADEGEAVQALLSINE